MAKPGRTFINLYKRGTMEFQAMRDKDIKFIEETMKFMEGQKIAADVVWHEPSEAKEVAANLCLKGDSVLKTLIFIKSDGSPVLVVLPSERKVSEKKLSALVGSATRLAKAKEVKSITGREVSGLSPFAVRTMTRTATTTTMMVTPAIGSVIVDESVKGKQAILAPAGPCASVKMGTADFFRLLGGETVKVGDVCTKRP